MKTQRRPTVSDLICAALILALLILFAPAAGMQARGPAFCSGIFFSEYVEGSGNNKALEIFNGAGEAIDLAAQGYSVEFYFNGNASPGATIPLTGTLAHGDVFVLADDGAAPAILAAADQIAATAFFNGDDAIVLRQGATVVDAIGQTGFDPGDGWGSGASSTRDNTLRRLPEVSTGDPDPGDAFDPAGQWQGSGLDDFAGLGAHEAGCAGGPGDCGQPATPIHQIQGSGSSSPAAGQLHAVEGVVVGDYQDTTTGLRGFFLQEEDQDADADPATSEGIFIYDNGFGVDVTPGDVVRVEGTVTEAFGLTEIAGLSSLTICGTGSLTPAAAALPVNSLDDWEALEGMAVTLSQPLTVVDTYNLGRYGQIRLSGSGRLFQFTHDHAPDPAGFAAHEAAVPLQTILLDDGNNQQNPDPVIFPPPGLSAQRTLRDGDTVTGLTGVVDFRFGEFRLQPVGAVTFDPANPRPAAPARTAGTLRIASFNVLNYFNGDGQGGGFPTARGADTAGEFQRQRAKIISAILALDADIVGLMEIENDGYGLHSAIQDLVDGLNAVVPAGVSYAFVDPGLSRLGSDAIAVGLLYRTGTVTPTGPAATLGAYPFDSRNRQPLAQTFREAASGESLTVAVNHFKSKGSCDSAAGADADQHDGQGCWNATRTEAATALLAWLASDPTASGDADFLIIGDLNSYANEDPVQAIVAAGYTNLMSQFLGGAAYSYVFDGQAGYLDHALASSGLAGQVAGAGEWHINADEPPVLDYNEEYKSPGQIAGFYAPDPYRASDHDPVLIDLALSTPARFSLFLPAIAVP